MVISVEKMEIWILVGLQNGDDKLKPLSSTFSPKKTNVVSVTFFSKVCELSYILMITKNISECCHEPSLKFLTFLSLIGRHKKEIVHARSCANYL